MYSYDYFLCQNRWLRRDSGAIIFNLQRINYGYWDVSILIDRNISDGELI